jgi:Methyltransferase FkbM domain
MTPPAVRSCIREALLQSSQLFTPMKVSRAGVPLRTFRTVATLLFFLCGSMLVYMSKQRTSSISSRCSPEYFHQFHTEFAIKSNSYSLGQWDSLTVMSVVSKEFHSDLANGYFTTEQAIVDVGLNVGQTSQKMLEYFTNYSSCVRIDSSQRCVTKNVFIVAFEPGIANFEHVKNISILGNWALGRWTGLQAAVGDGNYMTSFFASTAAGDQQASRDVIAAGSAFQEVQVPLLKLDTLFISGLHALPDAIPLIGDTSFKDVISARRKPSIYLLKIDAEGYDYTVLNGAKQLLGSKKVRFLSFEYNHKWFTNARATNLQKTVKFLRKLDYLCFWITDNSLIPVSGQAWSETYEIKEWSNLFCGVHSDDGLKRIVESYNLRGRRLAPLMWSCF